jgi:hypothetical protein
MAVGLPFKLSDYLERVELTGRAIRHNRKGYIERVESWMKMTTWQLNYSQPAFT